MNHNQRNTEYGIRNTEYGIRNTKKGFTLVEIMVAVAILSFGVVMLYEAFFTCLHAYSYCSNRLDVRRWMDEKIWQIQDGMVISGVLPTGELSGNFIDRNKKFAWKMNIDLISAVQDMRLYSLAIKVDWKEAQKDVSLSQEAYLLN